MILGFTGTRSGMTIGQVYHLRRYLLFQAPGEFHHGDCVGADAEAHDLVRKLLPNCRIIVHPCYITSARAYRQGDEILPPKEPLARNKDIVDICDLLVAVPATKQDVVRSGTWATIRYAERVGKNKRIFRPEQPS